MAIGLAGVLLALLQPEVRRFLRLERSRPIQVPELDRKQNARFSFSFQYPVTWDRHDPANQDGYRFQNPKDSRVSLSAWGRYSHLAGDSDSSGTGEVLYGSRDSPEFSHFANELINRARLDSRILDHRAHGLHTFSWREDGGRICESRGDLPGLRLKRELLKSGTRYISNEVWTLFDGIEYGICFEVPLSEFKRYEDLALSLVSSLRIIRRDYFNQISSAKGMDGLEGESGSSLHNHTPSETQSIPIPLVVDMPYSAARLGLKAAGWQHMALPAYGYNQSRQKDVSERPDEAELCNAFPELEECSAQGHCRMRFFDHQGNQLFVVTYGPILSDRQLVRNWWLIDKQPRDDL